jgi:hypothetical protein
MAAWSESCRPSPSWRPSRRPIRCTHSLWRPARLNRIHGLFSSCRMCGARVVGCGSSTAIHVNGVIVLPLRLLRALSPCIVIAFSLAAMAQSEPLRRVVSKDKTASLTVPTAWVVDPMPLQQGMVMTVMPPPSHAPKLRAVAISRDDLARQDSLEDYVRFTTEHSLSRYSGRVMTTGKHLVDGRQGYKLVLSEVIQGVPVISTTCFTVRARTAFSVAVVVEEALYSTFEPLANEICSSLQVHDLK